jgi:hypothetical protein
MAHSAIQLQIFSFCYLYMYVLQMHKFKLFSLTLGHLRNDAITRKNIKSIKSMSRKLLQNPELLTYK